MLKRNIVNDFSVLSKLSSKQANYLVQLLLSLLSDAILDAKLKNEAVVSLDLGISTILIDTKDWNWKSVPNQETKDMIKATITSGKSTFDQTILDSLSEKLINLVDGAI